MLRSPLNFLLYVAVIVIVVTVYFQLFVTVSDIQSYDRITDSVVTVNFKVYHTSVSVHYKQLQ